MNCSYRRLYDLCTSKFTAYVDTRAFRASFSTRTGRSVSAEERSLAATASRSGPSRVSYPASTKRRLAGDSEGGQPLKRRSATSKQTGTTVRGLKSTALSSAKGKDGLRDFIRRSSTSGRSPLRSLDPYQTDTSYDFSISSGSCSPAVSLVESNAAAAGATDYGEPCDSNIDELRSEGHHDHHHPNDHDVRGVGIAAMGTETAYSENNCYVAVDCAIQMDSSSSSVVRPVPSDNKECMHYGTDQDTAAPVVVNMMEDRRFNDPELYISALGVDDDLEYEGRPGCCYNTVPDRCEDNTADDDDDGGSLKLSQDEETRDVLFAQLDGDSLISAAPRGNSLFSPLAGPGMGAAVGAVGLMGSGSLFGKVMSSASYFLKQLLPLPPISPSVIQSLPQSPSVILPLPISPSVILPLPQSPSVILPLPPISPSVILPLPPISPSVMRYACPSKNINRTGDSLNEQPSIDEFCMINKEEQQTHQGDDDGPGEEEDQDQDVNMSCCWDDLNITAAAAVVTNHHLEPSVAEYDDEVGDDGSRCDSDLLIGRSHEGSAVPMDWYATTATSEEDQQKLQVLRADVESSSCIPSEVKLLLLKCFVSSRCSPLECSQALHRIVIQMSKSRIAKARRDRRSSRSSPPGRLTASIDITAAAAVDKHFLDIAKVLKRLCKHKIVADGLLLRAIAAACLVLLMLSIQLFAAAASVGDGLAAPRPRSSEKIIVGYVSYALSRLSIVLHSVFLSKSDLHWLLSFCDELQPIAGAAIEESLSDHAVVHKPSPDPGPPSNGSGAVDRLVSFLKRRYPNRGECETSSLRLRVWSAVLAFDFESQRLIESPIKEPPPADVQNSLVTEASVRGGCADDACVVVQEISHKNDCARRSDVSTLRRGNSLIRTRQQLDHRVGRQQKHVVVRPVSLPQQAVTQAHVVNKNRLEDVQGTPNSKHLVNDSMDRGLMSSKAMVMDTPMMSSKAMVDNTPMMSDKSMVENTPMTILQDSQRLHLYDDEHSGGSRDSCYTSYYNLLYAAHPNSSR